LAAATASEVPTIVVWDVQSGRKVETFPAPAGSIARLRFHEQEFLLGVVDVDGNAAVLDVRGPMATPGIRPIPREAPPEPPGPDRGPLAEAPDDAGPGPADATADAAGDAPYITVPVFYGTNRLPRTEDDAEWAYQFREFFITTLAFVLYAVCVLLPLAVAIVFNPRRRVTLAVFVGAMLLLFGFASVYATVKVRDIARRPAEYYGTRSGGLEYGRCEVTVPKLRELGSLPRPPSVWVFRGAEDPARHLVLQEVHPYDDPEVFVAELREHTVTRGEDELLVYVHGYNTSFEDAALRAAQLAVDLQMTGPPVFFSWPSHANAARYTFDETNALASDTYLREFLETLVRQCGAKKIHLLAHSMGNIVLTDALRELTRDLSSEERAIVHEVVLAAPDIDRRVFLREIAPAIAPNHHVTLYVSAKDVALGTSRRFHDHQRAGDARPQITLFEGIDTIDASFVDTSKLGHSYYSEQVPVLFDLLQLFKNGYPPAERPSLEKLNDGGRSYWKLVAGSN
jgi:esterase/lipase superfamily enzyme